MFDRGRSFGEFRHRFAPVVAVFDENLVEEMYVDDGLEGLLGKSPSRLQVRQYPGAVAAALILRHSWRADDLACILERLGMTNGRKSTLPRPSPKTTRKRVSFSG